MRALWWWWFIPFAGGCLWDRGDAAGGAVIQDVTIFQGPAVPLVADSQLVQGRTAPVLAGRPGRIVAHVGFEQGSEVRDIAVRFHLGAHELTATGTMPAGATPVEVFVDFDASDLDVTATFSAEVVEQHGFTSNHDVLAGQRLPATGAWPLDARQAPRFRVEVVPLTTHDGLVTVTQADLDRWQANLYAFLPVSGVDITLGAGLSTPTTANRDQDWGIVLGLVAARRAAEGLPPDTFMYAAVPSAPQAAIGGIAPSLTVENPYWHVAAGQVGGGNIDVESGIVAHELGHALGRSHAPCGNPGGPDYGYPYTGAIIGIDGLDLRDNTARDRAQYFDFMSYCHPYFVSDYQFGALFDSLTYLADRGRPAEAPPLFVTDPLPQVRR